MSEATEEQTAPTAEGGESVTAKQQQRKQLVEFIYAQEHEPFNLKIEPSGSKKKKLLEPTSVVVKFFRIKKRIKCSLFHVLV